MGVTFGSAFTAALGVVAALAILEVFIDILLVIAICFVVRKIRRRMYGYDYGRRKRGNHYHYHYHYKK